MQVHFTPYDGYLGALAASMTAGLVVWGFVKGFFKAVHPLKGMLASMLSSGAKIEEVSKKVDIIAKEVRPNGGASLRDGQNRIERDVSHIKAALSAEEDLNEEPRWRADRNGAVTFANKRFCDLVGRPAEEIAGMNWKNTIHPEDLDRVAALWVSAVADKRDTEFHYRIVRPDGTPIPVHARGVVKRDGNGEVIGWFGTVRVSVPVSPKTEEAFPSTPPKPRKRILVIEDGEDFRQMCKLALTPKYDVEAHPSGPIALQEFTAAQIVGKPFDLVIIDYMMPDMDGAAVARALRDAERDRFKTKMLFLSGIADGGIAPTVESECRMLPAWRKPIPIQDLLNNVARELATGSE